jgi:hypothetical protein
LRIGQTLIVIGRMRIRPQNILKVVITTQNKKSALLVKRHLRPHVPDCIYKEASTSFGHTLTCSSKHKFEAAVGEEIRERERDAFLGEDFLYLFELSLGIVLAIYIKEFFVGFSPP